MIPDWNISVREARAATLRCLVKALAAGPRHEIEIAREIGTDPVSFPARVMVRKLLSRIATVEGRLSPHLLVWRAKRAEDGQ